MSDITPTRPGTSRASQLLTATRKAPRKLRIAGIAGLITVAGSVAMLAAPAAASASTVNPKCAVPIGYTWQLVDSYQLDPPAPFPMVYEWTTTYNGVPYNGETLVPKPPNSLPQGNGVCAPVGQSIPPLF